MLTEWQVYRMFEARRGAWSTFQFLVREQLATQGVDVAPDGTLTPAQVAAAVRRRAWPRSAHSGHVGVEQRQPAELGARRPRTPTASPTISVRFSSRHEIVAFSSVSTTAHTLPGPQVSSSAPRRSSCSARARRAALDVDAGDERHGRAASVREREAAREEAAELEPDAAVEAVAAAHDRRIARDVAAGAAQRRRAADRRRALASPWIARSLTLVHRHERARA